MRVKQIVFSTSTKAAKTQTNTTKLPENICWNLRKEYKSKLKGAKS